MTTESKVGRFDSICPPSKTHLHLQPVMLATMMTLPLFLQTDRQTDRQTDSHVWPGCVSSATFTVYRNCMYWKWPHCIRWPSIEATNLPCLWIVSRIVIIVVVTLNYVCYHLRLWWLVHIFVRATWGDYIWLVWNLVWNLRRLNLFGLKFGQYEIWSIWNLVGLKLGQYDIWMDWNVVGLKFGQFEIWSIWNLIRNSRRFRQRVIFGNWKFWKWTCTNRIDFRTTRLAY